MCGPIGYERHRFNGKVSDPSAAGETPQKPLIVHEVRPAFKTQGRATNGWLRVGYQNDVTLLEGDRGTGKTTLARSSPRCPEWLGPWLAVLLVKAARSY